MHDSAPPPSRLFKAYYSSAKWLLWLLLTGWLLFALAWGALHGIIVPRIGEYRADLEIEASRVLGIPVRIGSVTARTDGLVPSFELGDVALLDGQGREALKLPRVIAALSPRSLWNLGFEQLYIDQPVLDIRRGTDGRISVAGLDLSKRGAEGGEAADWFFAQREFVISRGTLRWTDEQRGAPALELSGVDFVVRNDGRRHALRIDATPPPGWGARFTLAGLFRHPLLTRRSGDWQQWDGQLHGDFAQVDVSALGRYADLGVAIAEGNGALRFWADVSKGVVQGGVADVALAEVTTTLGKRLAPLGLEAVAGRLGGKRLGRGGFEFSTEQLGFRTREGAVWPGGNVALRLQEAQGSTPAQGELKADRIDLAAIGQIASHLPLASSTHAALAAYAPSGLLESVTASWQGPVDAPVKYRAAGRVSRLTISARPASALRNATPTRSAAGTPGVRNAAVDFEFTEAGGKAKVAIADGAIDLPGVFAEPLVPLDSLSADAQWQLDGQRISVALPNLRFSNADTQGDAEVRWQTGDGRGGRTRFPGVLDLQGNLARAQAVRVQRYLPLAMAPSVREYVRDAITGGEAHGVKFRVKGDLRELPFVDPKSGEFRIAANLRDVDFAYVPHAGGDATTRWPALDEVAGEMVFERNSMRLSNMTGRLAAAPAMQMLRGSARIADLGPQATVEVGVELRGPLADALVVVASSPLATLTGHALAASTATGTADIRLALAVPLQQPEQSRVSGSVTLAGNDVRISPQTPVLARARGVVGFTDNGFTAQGVQARLLGGDVRLEGGTVRPAAGATAPPTAGEVAISMRVQGTATAEALRQSPDLGFASRLARYANGSAAYNATLQVRRGGATEVLLASTLQGMALSLPAPLAKSAEVALPLRFENTLLPAAPGSTARTQDQLLIELGRVASVLYVRDISGAEPRVLRGAIGVGLAAGESAPLPEQGVVANINLASVDLDAWEAALGGASGVAAASGTSPAPLRSAAGGTASAALSYVPTVMAVRAKELTVEGRKLHNVVVGGSREGPVWRANLDATELNGYVEYRQGGAGRVHARLARLSIAQSTASEVEALLSEQPATLPALDIVVDELELKGRKLGRFEMDAVNRGGTAVAREGGVREWRVNKLSLAVPEAVFSATGNWAAVGAQPLPPGQRPSARASGERRRMALEFKLEVADSGQLLNRFGMRDVVRRGKGKLEGQIGWVGSPLAFDYPSMEGYFNIDMQGGQFLKADPGIAKLLSVLSLQTLPRRLTLDFRDVFSQGFAFDFVRGDVTIEEGIAATNNLQMKGSTAAVLMDGKADIAKETQDVRAVVVPELDAGTASLLVATAINPVLGLSSYLAQLFLKRPLIAAATQEFHIDGTWADPRITRVPRSKRSVTPPANAERERDPSEQQPTQ